MAGTNWRLNSATHFAERHGLIIIVALGESIVSIGIGVADLPVSWPIIVASGLGLKKVLSYVAGDDGHTLADPIYGVPLAALYGGAALYLLAHVVLLTVVIILRVAWDETNINHHLTLRLLTAGPASR